MVRFIIRQCKEEQQTYKQHLHSNMVRFIISNRSAEHNKRYVIYIPIWLDLLSETKRDKTVY